MSLAPEDLIGCWLLDDWYVEAGDGSRGAPFGHNAKGMIIYTADGWMSASIGTAERALPADNPEDKQKAEAFASYFNYVSTWRVDGDTVVHKIEQALDPNLIGAEMVRTVDHDGNRMVFTGLMPDGKAKAVIAWKRP